MTLSRKNFIKFSELQEISRQARFRKFIFFQLQFSKLKNVLSARDLLDWIKIFLRNEIDEWIKLFFYLEKLRNALEEVHVLKEENRRLLERYNKCSHELRILKESKKQNTSPTGTLQKVENLQYEIAKDRFLIIIKWWMNFIRIFTQF